MKRWRGIAIVTGAVIAAGGCAWTSTIYEGTPAYPEGIEYVVPDEYREGDELPALEAGERIRIERRDRLFGPLIADRLTTTTVSVDAEGIWSLSVIEGSSQDLRESKGIFERLIDAFKILIGG